MDYQKEFSNILGEDEKIIESYKPNKVRAVSFTIIRNTVLFLVMAAFIVLFALLPNSDDSEVTCMIDGVERSGEVCEELNHSYFFIVPLIIGVVLFAFYVVSIFTTILKHKRTFFCFTNKRVIVTTGYFKSSIQSIEYKDILDSELKIDFLDKVSRQNTGTLIFTSKPNKDGEEFGDSIHFFHIEEPVETLKKIKEQMK